MREREQERERQGKGEKGIERFTKRGEGAEREKKLGRETKKRLRE